MSDQFRIVVNDRLVDIGDLKVAELKVELKKRGISVTGNKQELVDKLKNYLIKSQEHQQMPVSIPQPQVQYQSPQKLNQNIQFQPQQLHQSPEQFHHQFLQQPQLQQSPQQIAFAANNFHIQQQQQLQHEVMLQQQLLQQQLQQQQQQQQNFYTQQQQLLNNNLNNGSNSFPVDSYENPIIPQAIPHNNPLNTEHNNAHLNTNNIQQVEMNNSVTHAVEESTNNHVVVNEPQVDTSQIEEKAVHAESQPVVEEQNTLVNEEKQPVVVEPEPAVEPQQQSPAQLQEEPKNVTEEQMDQATVEQEELHQQTEDNKENKKEEEEETHVSSEEQTNKMLDVSTNELNDSSKLNESVDTGQNGDLPKLQRKRKWLNNEAANILTNKKSLTISSDTLKTYLPTPPANQDEEHKITASSTSNTEPEAKQPHVTANRDVQLEDNELIYEDALTATNNNATSQAESKQEEPITAKATTTASPSKRPISNVLHISNLTRPFTLPQLKELLSKYGRILRKGSDDLFWINPVKSHCFVAFEKEEEARLAREALHNTSWPQSNPKQLHIEYSKMDELVSHMNSDKPVSLVPPSKTSTHEKSSSAVNGSEKSHEPKESSDTKAKREQTSTKTSSVREWDLPKLNRARSRSPVKERQHTSSTTASENKKEKTVSANNKPVEQEKQQQQQPKTLDDLFRKTKTAPFIYWLPLTEEQYLERQKEHEKRMVDRLKRAEERKAREAAVAVGDAEKTVAPEVKSETIENKTEGEKEASETAANNRVRERETTVSEKEKLERERQREKERERERIRERERERERERDRMRETDRYRDREREREREMRERQREREMRERERERRRSPPTSSSYRRSSRDRQASSRYESRPTRRRSPSTASSRSSSSRSSSSGSSTGSSRSSSRSSRSSSSSNSSRSRSSSASSNGSKHENENKKNAPNVNLNNSSKHSRSSSENSNQRKKRRE